MQVLKRIRILFKHTIDYVVLFLKSEGLIGFCDSNWFGEKVERRIIIEYVYKLFNCAPRRKNGGLDFL